MIEHAYATTVGAPLMPPLVPRPDLIETLGAGVREAYGISLHGEFHRAMEDRGPMPVVLCLGQGRCLYPYGGAATRVCPFCRTLPGTFTGQCNSVEALRQHVQGH